MINIKKIIIVLVISLHVGIVNAQTSFPTLEKQVKQKQFTKAYLRAIKIRAKNEGDPRFDYLYGLSALQTGHYNEAVFALDRVTVSTPNVIRPRLELARAYLKLNNKSAAIKEFNDVLKLSPPPVVEQKVLTYIAELIKGDKKIAQSITKRLASFSIGYNDNINFGSENTDVELPGFGIIALNPSAIKQQSAFAEAKFQIRKRNNKNRLMNTFLVANLTHRTYFKESDFDFTSLGFRAGVTFNKRKNQYQFVVKDQPVFLDGSLHSNTLGVDLIARKSIGDAKVVSVSLSIENYDNKTTPLSDRKRALLGLRLDQHIGETQNQFNLYGGTEWPNKNAGKQFSRNIVGVGYRATKDWNSRNKSFLNLDYRRYKHKAAYPVFPDKRKDERYIVTAQHEWQFSDSATVLFTARHTNNMSNLDLYDAKRNEVKVGIRYEWD